MEYVVALLLGSVVALVACIIASTRRASKSLQGYKGRLNSFVAPNSVDKTLNTVIRFALESG